MTERERNRPGTPDQGPRAVGDQAAPRLDGSGPRNSDEHSSGLGSDAGGGLIAVDSGEATRYRFGRGPADSDTMFQLNDETSVATWEIELTPCLK